MTEKNYQTIVLQHRQTKKSNQTVYSLLHEVVHFRVDSLDYGHQVVQDVFSVVHSGVHEVPVM